MNQSLKHESCIVVLNTLWTIQKNITSVFGLEKFGTCSIDKMSFSYYSETSTAETILSYNSEIVGPLFLCKV